MNGHGPCGTCPEQAVAWIRLPDGTHFRLCKLCLDAWFDLADEQPQLEPRIWGWLVPPAPATEDITAWARDPRNHRAVAEVLRREARIDPRWLRDFARREERAGRLAFT